VIVRIVWSLRKAAFVYPIPPAPRTAVLLPGFRPSGSIRVFPDGWNEEAKQFEPQALAGSVLQLEGLAGVASPSHALIVMRNEWEPRFTDSHRTFLWKAFRVPAFEQIIDEDGTLLATECEAHEGLHIESPRFTAADHKFHSGRCACGRVTPRLVSAQRVEAARRLAACVR
jgi:hypothetical protein